MGSLTGAILLSSRSPPLLVRGPKYSMARTLRRGPRACLPMHSARKSVSMVMMRRRWARPFRTEHSIITEVSRAISSAPNRHPEVPITLGRLLRHSTGRAILGWMDTIGSKSCANLMRNDRRLRLGCLGSPCRARCKHILRRRRIIQESSRLGLSRRHHHSLGGNRLCPDPGRRNTVRVQRQRRVTRCLPPRKPLPVSWSRTSHAG